MSRFTDAELDDFAGAMLVANAPISLWLWLDAHAGVRRVAAFVNESAILDDLVQLAQTGSSDLRVVAERYSLLTALLAQRRAKGPVGDPPLDLGGLRWGARIWARAAQGARSTGGGTFVGQAPEPTMTPVIQRPTTKQIITFGGE